MPTLEHLLNTLKTGTREEKGVAVTELAKLKDPRAFDALREVVESEDQELASMALYPLAFESGGEPVENLKAFISFFKPEISKLLSSAGISSEYLLQDVNLFNPGGVMDDVFKLLDQHQPEEAREKIHELLHICTNFDLPENIPFSKFYRLGMRRNIGILKIGLGMVEMQLGNMDASINFSNEALEIGEEIEDGHVITIAIGNLGVACMEMDRYYDALEYFHKSLDLMKEYIDPWRKKNRVLYNMSILYNKIGNTAESRKYADLALSSLKEENDPVGTAWCLNASGINTLLEGDDRAAEELFIEALECCTSNGNRQTEASVLSNIGFLHQGRGEYDKALEALDKALRIFKDVKNMKDAASALVNKAYLYMELNRIEEAHICAIEALELAGKTAGLRDDADACYIVGTIEHYCNHNLEKAYGYYKEAIELFEKIRTDAALDELKITFAENSANSYAQMVTLCLETNRADEAFEYVEKSKSRALVDLLSRAVDGIHSHTLSKEKMEEISRLKERLSWLRNNLNQLYRGAGVVETGKREGRPIGENEREATYNEIMETEKRYMAAYQDVKRIDPEWASISKVEPFNADEAAELLDAGTALVEYYQTSDRLYIFVIAKDRGISSFQVEADAGGEFERLFQLLQSLGGDTVLDVRSHAFLKDVRLPLSHFYRLLIAPIEEAIGDISRLIIVPHLFWHHLPFHALYDEERGEYLIDRFKVGYAPSAEVLKYCRKKNDPDRRTAAIFANPTGDLPFAEEEAQKVAACFGPDVKVFRGQNATLKNLESLEDTDIIHLACHGVFRADEPVFSHLLLADDNAGHGACFLPDIFNLKLKTPTLVAISACESGLNRPSSGDDLIGFARGFFYAGAPSVLATLWRVNDKSTACFMEEFYNGLIHDNLTKSKALQLAIQKIKSMEEYRHPFFWAPFVLMGDWI